MNGRYETDDFEEPAPAPADREISLGTGAMLAIFFALVLVCGAFFGFGYSMGHKATPVVAAGAGLAPDADGAAAPAQVAEGGGTPGLGSSEVAPAVVVKPSAGSGVRTGTALGAGAAAVTSGVGKKAANVVGESVKDAEAPTTPAVRPAVRPANTAPAGSSSTAVATAAPGDAQTVPPSAASSGAPAAGAPIYVQISAVSHQEDAQLLTTALKRRGYDPTVRHSAQDQLLHVQLGPFATKKEADAVKQRLSADGYNAILK